MDCSLPGSSIHGTLQTRILEWVAIPFSRGPSQCSNRTWVSCTAGRCFTIWANQGSHKLVKLKIKSRVWQEKLHGSFQGRTSTGRIHSILVLRPLGSVSGFTNHQGLPALESCVSLVSAHIWGVLEPYKNQSYGQVSPVPPSSLRTIWLLRRVVFHMLLGWLDKGPSFLWQRNTPGASAALGMGCLPSCPCIQAQNPT